MYNIMAKHPFISAAHNIWQKSAIFYFHPPRNVAMATNFLLAVFLCHARSPKRHEIGKKIGLEVQSEVVCDLSNGTLTVDIASGFYHWFDDNYFRKYATNLREIFSIGSLSGVDDCCEMELRSLRDVATATNFCERRTLFLWKRTFLPLDISTPNISLTLACDGIRQEVQVLH